MSQVIEEKCTLQLSMDIIIVVIVFNATKLAAMVYVLYQFDAERILASVGDAMASFMV